MAAGRKSAALPRFLFRFTVLAASVLIGVVALAPWLDDGAARLDLGNRLVALFARDLVVRRTMLASAIGLYVTAGVFFRSPDKRRSLPPRTPKRPPSTPMVGA
jgi:hypothetical protein